MLAVENFYGDLPTLDLPLPEVFQQRLFVDVPASWYIIIADVKNSTSAVNAGKHNEVNLVAASSIIAAINVAKKAEVHIPFFFTGDGATILVPNDLLQPILGGLTVHNSNSMKNFGLEMHLGYTSFADIKDAGHFLQIAKVQFGKGLSKPLVIGDGLKYAEKKIKYSVRDKNDPLDEPETLDLNGLECRWDKVKPPLNDNEVVCYLIEAVDPQKQMEVYAGVLQKMEEAYGPLEERNPLSVDRLKLLVTFQKIRTEILAKFGKWKAGAFFTAFLETVIGRFFLRYNINVKTFRGQEYLRQVINNADILTIDGRINTIISGKKDNRLQFIAYLSEQEKAGRLVYGHFISKESVITCYIQDRDTRHIHFVDGSDGGYTEASKELKRKL